MKRNIERIGKTIISGLVVTGLVLGNGSLIQAEKVTKEESVYVNADASGTATKITVSDWLKNAGVNGTLSDKSSLKDIANVKGEEAFVQNGDGVEWSAGADDIYYQGTTDKELPVGVSIAYELDGTELPPEQMAGKSGKVKIKVAYSNSSKVTKKINGRDQELSTPFFMATGFILPTETFTNVEIDHGRVINEGTNQIVIGFGMPGMAESLDVDGEVADKMPESFEITADVSEFSLGNTITYASSSIFSELEVEDDDTFEDLEDSLDTLVDSSEELVRGSRKLSNSLGELKSKFSDYEDGEKELNKGIRKLAESGGKLAKGMKEYTKGASTLAKGTTEYVNGAKKITAGNLTLYNAVKDMPKSYKEFSDGIRQYTNGVDELAKKETAEALKGGASSVSKGVSKVNEGLCALEKSYENDEALIAAMKTQVSLLEDEVQKQTMLTYITKLEELSTGQKQSVASLVQATGANGELKKGADQVAAGIGKVLQGADTLSSKSEALRAADGKMTASIQSLVSNIEKLKEGGQKLSANDRKLLAGAKKLLKAGNTVNKGSKQLVSGADQLKKGSNELHEATGDVAEGIGKLKEGASDLYDGMGEFDSEGIQEIRTKYEEDFSDLKDRLSALLDVSKEYNNFSGIGDGMDGDVKFIIETEEIGGEDKEE